jgi:phospholipid/cholesterol/gamma-HCH transport system ATP-binding protein
MANQRNEAPIVIENLQKSFGAQKVLNGISFRVERGETLAVLGRSGGGKSVLLKLIIGLQQPDSGSIRVAGEDMSHLNVEKRNQVRKKVGFLFQQAALYDSLTVEENVGFPLRRHTKMADAERNELVRELLAQVGMERDLEKMPSELSGGMQKRVGLARALALEPEILLFDEPTAGLDPITAGEIGQLITDLEQKKEMAAIVVTHDVHGAQQYSDRVALLQEGKFVAEGSFADLQQSRDEYVNQFLGDGSRR